MKVSLQKWGGSAAEKAGEILERVKSGERWGKRLRVGHKKKIGKMKE